MNTPKRKEAIEKYYTMSDVAKQLKMSRQTLYTHVAAGHLKPRRFGRYSVLSEAEIARFARRLRTIHVDGRERMVLA